MPGGNRTGPMGMGAMTGRAAGFCAGNAMPGYMNPVPGRGIGRGFGRGVGFRLRQGFRSRFLSYGGQGGGRGGWGFRRGMDSFVETPYPAPAAGQELDMLKEQAEYFTGALDDIKQRIDELKADQKK